ncbi:mersacidin family lantibiotic [Mediterraneibacter agrestimuris]|uniref:mersacidin family lantibiotic n=1 Tax=Mediterraneibacter agrestimuris TaxID=2941333 RepID=UPI00203F73CF|nr:lichenicidin A2 family type 2 lantibiotic [Mediterraneibacter agrestimuris]
MAEIKIDNEKLMAGVKKIQDKYGFVTQEEYAKFAKENPEKTHVVIGEAGLALIDAMVGKPFEELTVDDMSELQGAGADVDPETTVICFLASASVGGVLSALKC